ncbi:MAG: hypothetical protein ABR598_04910 [Candidatus Dormibacteria bacterium]
MNRKLLPLPVGADAPAGSAVRFWQQYSFRARLDALALALGLSMAMGGAWLGTHPTTVSVSRDRAGYHLGGTLLAPVGAGRYGGDTAVVIEEAGDHVRASAAGRLRGSPMQGLCTFVRGSSTERCEFVVGGRNFRAEDRARGGAWLRRYDDGRTVEIRQGDPSNPTPVPIPIGWR